MVWFSSALDRGVDALSKQDFLTVAASARTYLDVVGNDLGRIAGNEWINCGITWVKGADGTVERWLQPKLSPAWPEQNVLYQDMFHGNSVFAFKGTLNNGTHYRFCSLVCFDWIGRQLEHHRQAGQATSGPDAVEARLHSQRRCRTPGRQRLCERA